jgi:hypothetical protein
MNRGIHRLSNPKLVSSCNINKTHLNLNCSQVHCLLLFIFELKSRSVLKTSLLYSLVYRTHSFWNFVYEYIICNTLCRWWSRHTCGFLSAMNNSVLFSYNDVKCTKYLISITTYKEVIVPRHICKSIIVYPH